MKPPSRRESDGNTSIPARRVRTSLISCRDGKLGKTLSLSETVTFLKVPSTDVGTLHSGGTAESPVISKGTTEAREGMGSAGLASGEGVFPHMWGQVCFHLCGAPQAILNQSWETWPALPALTATAGSAELQEGALSGSQSKTLDSRAQVASTPGERGLLCVSAWMGCPTPKLPPGWTFAKQTLSFRSGILFMGTKSSLVFMLVVFFRYSLIHSNVYSESAMYSPLC